MATVGNLVVNLKANTVQFARGMKGASQRLGAFTKQTFSAQNALVALASTAALGLAAKKMFDLGAAVEETASKFNTVFGPATESVQDFIDDFATMAGLSQTAAKEIVATTGAIVQGMGLAQDASAKYAEEVVRLAGDLTSFNDVPIEETARAIQSAITGERESLKRLGIVILETDVQKRALVDTGKALAKELTQEEKALATLALITERAGVAIGDLERTQFSSANQARFLAAEFKNVAEQVATALMPALSAMLPVLRSLVEKTGEWATQLAGIMDTARIIMSDLNPTLEANLNTIRLMGDDTDALSVFFAKTAIEAEKLKEQIAGMDQPSRPYLFLRDIFLPAGADIENAKQELEGLNLTLDHLRNRIASLAGEAAGAGAGAGGGDAMAAFIARFKEGEIVVKGLSERIKHLGNETVTMSAKATDAFEDVDFAIRSAAESMAQDFSNAFTDVITFTESLADAFRRMVNNILRELARLAIQRSIIEPLVGALTAGLSASVGTSSTPATVVNQNIVFSPNMIDAESGAAFLQEQGGTIAQIIGDAARQSSGFVAVLNGG